MENLCHTDKQLIQFTKTKDLWQQSNWVHKYRWHVHVWAFKSSMHGKQIYTGHVKKIQRFIFRNSPAVVDYHTNDKSMYSSCAFLVANTLWCPQSNCSWTVGLSWLKRRRAEHLNVRYTTHRPRRPRAAGVGQREDSWSTQVWFPGDVWAEYGLGEGETGTGPDWFQLCTLHWRNPQWLVNPQVIFFWVWEDYFNEHTIHYHAMSTHGHMCTVQYKEETSTRVASGSNTAVVASDANKEEILCLRVFHKQRRQK